MSDSAQNDSIGDQWRFWQEAARHAGNNDWEKIRALLAKDPAERPSLHFAASVFTLAAKAGELGIVEEMLCRGYKIEAEEGARLLRGLALFPTPQTTPVINFLLKGKLADPEQAVKSLAARNDQLGTVEMMEVFRQAQADILCGGSSFFLAHYACNLKMMEYLHGHDADLYHPAIVASQYGRRAEVKAEAVQLYRMFLDGDRKKALASYAEEEQRGVVSLTLAARAGKLPELLTLTQANGKPVTADDLIAPANGGAPALAVAAAQGDLPALFDLAHWRGRSDEVKKLYEALESYKATGAVDLGQLDAAAESRRLHALSAARRDKWRLRP